MAASRKSGWQMPVLRMALRLEFHEAQAIFFLPSMPRKVKVEIRPRQKKITRRILLRRAFWF
jgi:hypothetical protein